MQLSQVIAIAKQAGFSGTGLITAVAIAIAESALNSNATGDVNLQTSKWGPSVGLWQIRTLKPAYLPLEPIRDITKLYDPLNNAKAAYTISKGGTDFSPWSTFISQQYLNFTDQVNHAAQFVSDHGSELLLFAAIAAYFILN
jgi:hypothetical protein